MSKASKNTSHRKLFTVVGDAPFQFVEAYKSLRTNLEFLLLCRQLQDHPDHLLRSRRRQDQRGRQPGHDD